MGNLTVAYKGDDMRRTKFTVNVEGNFTISNTKNKGKLANHETRTTVKNGRANTYYKWGNTPNATLESVLNLNYTNYTIFDGIRKADKNDKKGEKLTQSDLEALRKDKALQKKLGVTVKYDAQEKVYGIYGKNDAKLYFDFD